MKKYLLTASLLALIVSCGPTETQENEMKDLVAAWKNTSAKAISLYEEVGDKTYVVNSTGTDGNSEEMTMISFDGMETSCQAAYETLNNSLDEFIVTWQNQSEKVDELTNAMAIGKWTDQDQELMEAMELELKQKDVQLEQWKNDLEELNQKCGLSAEAMVIQEQGS